MASQYSIDINGNKVTVQTFNVSQGAGAKGEVLKIRLPQGAKVEIADTSTKFATAPKGFRTKKVGNDLHMAFQGSEMAKPDVVIEGFYGKNGAPAELIAKGAKGEYFAFNVPTTEAVGSTTPVMGKTAVSPWGNIAGPVEPVIAAERAAPVSDPAAVSAATGLPPEGSTTKLGALGWVGGGLLLAAAAAGGGGGGGDSAPLNGAGPIKNLSANSAQVNEGEPLVFQVALNATPTSTAAFKFSVTGIDPSKLTFDHGVKYDGGYITVPAGVTSFTASVLTNNDTVYTANQAISVRIYDDTSSTFSVSASGTIVDNDIPKVASVASAQAVEQSPLDFLVQLANASASPTKVSLTLAAGSATSGADFTPAMQVSFDGGATWNAVDANAVTVPAGSTSFLIRVPTLTDTVAEPNETVTLSATSEFNSAAVSGTGTIIDDKGDPKISITSNVPVIEGDAANFTVSLSRAASTSVTVSYSTANGTATASSDYSAASGTLTFQPGETTKTISIGTTQDSLFEGTTPETFTVNLSNASANATIAVAQGTGSIADDDGVPTIGSVSNASATEGSSITHTVNLTGTSVSATSFAFSLTGSSATGGGTDFTSALTNAAFSSGVTISGGNISVPGNVTSFTVTVPTTQDTTAEPDETYTLTVGGKSGTGTIVNDDAAPFVASVGSGSAAEGNTAAGNPIDHLVTVTGTSATPTNIPFSLGGGTATAGTDYSTTVSASNGVTVSGNNFVLPANFSGSFTVTVNTIGDTTVESTETYTLTVGGVAGTGTITNDDTTPAPAVTAVSAASAAEGDTPTGNPIVHTVTVSGNSATTTNIPFTLGGGTATAGTDYSTTVTASNGVTVSGGNLVLPANFGAGTFTVTVNTIGDTTFEPTETYTLTVGGVAGTGTITNDDAAAPTPTVTAVSAASAAEGDTPTGNPIVHTVTVSGNSATTTNIPFTLGGGTATAGTDYSTTVTASNGVTVSGGNLVLPANFGAGTFTVTVNTIGDTTFEPTETYTLTVGGVAGTGTITNDDAAASTPTVTTVSAASAAEGAPVVHTVTLSAATTAITNYTATLASGTATVGTDLAASLTESTTDHGVTFSGGNFVVPAGVSTFTVSIPTKTDALVESAETYTLTVGSVDGTGTITNVTAGGPATVMSLSSVSATSDTYTPTTGHVTTIADFTTGIGGDLIDVSAFLGAVAAPATSTSVNGIVTAQGAFAGATPTAQQVATLLAQVTVADGSHHVVLVKDSADASKAYVYYTEETAADTNKTIDASELSQVATINFSAGSTFEDLVLHNIQPTL